LTSVTEGKPESDTEGSIVDYVNDAKGSSKSNSLVLSDDEGSSSRCDQLRGRYSRRIGMIRVVYNC